MGGRGIPNERSWHGMWGVLLALSILVAGECHSIGPGTIREIAVQAHSMLLMMGAMAVHVDVPAQHIRGARAPPGVGEGEAAAVLEHQTQSQIHSSRDRPNDAFVAVEYRDHWF